MIWRNTVKRYGAVAQGFHWLVALCVICLLGVGLYMTRLDPSPTVFKIYALHKSIGITVLSLAVLRLIWKLTNPHPQALATHAVWEKFLARLIHVFLYFAIIGMPLSGWIMSSAKNFPVSVFNLFTLPNLVGPSEDIARAAVMFHGLTAWVLMAAIFLHVAGALKHHVMDKDATLTRMVPGLYKKEN